MKEQAIKVQIRPALIDEVPFILHSWTKSNHKYSSFFHQIPPAVYFPQQKKTIQFILSESFVMVACNKEDEKQLFGYIVWEEFPSALVYHYIYIKQTFRQLGIASALIENSFIGKPFTFHTHICDRFYGKNRSPSGKITQSLGSNFNPYLFSDIHLRKIMKEYKDDSPIPTNPSSEIENSFRGPSRKFH